MSKTYKIKRGLDIKLQGAAEKLVKEYSPKTYALKPLDFIGVVPKVILKEGEKLKAGQNVFFDKKREDIFFSSPVSGILKEIKRGQKRVIEEIIIEADEQQEYLDFGKQALQDLSKEEITKKLLTSGMWSFIRQRPYDVIANPEDKPKAIYIKAFDSAPLAADYDLMLKKEISSLQKGIDVLKKMTETDIYFNLHKKLNQQNMYSDLKGVQTNYFEGKHPASNISTQIFYIDPLNKGEIVWHIDAMDLVAIGKLFEEGHYKHEKIIALCGSEIKNPRYYRMIQGASIEELIKDELKQDNVRIISGDILTGTKIEKNGFLSAYKNQLTVITEGNHYSFLGWILPGFKKYSVSRTYTAWLFPKKKYKMHTNLNGGKRPFVMTGIYEKVIPMDIMPMHLCKAILAEDIELMENMGIYEVVPEDFALAEVICPSKTEMQEIIANGLEFLRKEMS